MNCVADRLRPGAIGILHPPPGFLVERQGRKLLLCAMSVGLAALGCVYFRQPHLYLPLSLDQKRERVPVRYPHNPPVVFFCEARKGQQEDGAESGNKANRSLHLASFWGVWCSFVWSS